MSFKAVIFDLDGVLLSTDRYHYQAWKKLADERNIYFDTSINERLRGVSRIESLEIILERSESVYSKPEKEAMASAKNEIYRQLLDSLSSASIFPGVIELLDELDRRGLKKAIGSSSKNAGYILKKVGLSDRFAGVVCDGTHITRSKPDPQVFLKAAILVNVLPEYCLVIEDADAGVLAAKAAGMSVLGMGSAAEHPECDLRATTLSEAAHLILEKVTRSVT
ncbi:MAG: beta-phosphoglucomutase [Candidatus Marinimicrobia bacterium]|nr:beta-phosphoglucomutase [Candidatus Neomarinimicrobiota bacterium]